MGYPSFSAGDTLAASDMNAVALWKITQTSATSGSVVNIDNIFTTTFASYHIVFTASCTTVTGLSLQLRSGGTTLGTSGYYNVRQGFDYSTGAAGAAATSNGPSWNIAAITDSTAAGEVGCSINIYNPKATKMTTYDSVGTDTRTTGYGALSSSGIYTPTTSCDGVAIGTSSLWRSITVVVYGWRN